MINEFIKYPKIRLIDFKGTQLGIYFSTEALKIALNQGLDLLVIDEKSNPPVCKIIDYGKYKFNQEKKNKEIKKKQSHTLIKEVKMRYKIENHDYQVRLNQTLRFLQSGNKVKLTIVFRGREIQHFNLAFELLNKIAKNFYQISIIQQPPIKDGKNITMTLSPLKKK
uniref:Translation initiation factor IF-3 n=1 Tax=Harveyella mirabilis TaxID=282355 RepID=A0A3S8UW30_9FLOR|nr:translation initiation factor 3 [Harveyella mirabilis]